MDNVFSFRNRLVEEYSAFSQGFTRIGAADIRSEVERQYAKVFPICGVVETGWALGRAPTVVLYSGIVGASAECDDSPYLRQIALNVYWQGLNAVRFSDSTRWSR